MKTHTSFPNLALGGKEQQQRWPLYTAWHFPLSPLRHPSDVDKQLALSLHHPLSPLPTQLNDSALNQAGDCGRHAASYCPALPFPGQAVHLQA